MAKDWYGRAHAGEMASRTIGEWVEALRPMLVLCQPSIDG
jgi:hypothetical protein